MNESVAIAVSIASLVSLLVAGFTTYVLATIENKLTSKFDERYVLQKENVLLIQERDRWREDINRRLDEFLQHQKVYLEVVERMEDGMIAEIKETRESMHRAISDLREEFLRRNQL